MHAGVTALVLAGGLALYGGASEEPAVYEEVSGGSHCVVFVTDQAADGELAVSKPDCFSSVILADTWAAAGSPAGLDSQSDGVSAASTFVLGRHYDGFNGSGSSIAVVGSSCTGGYWNTGSSWANRISSSYSGCPKLAHYDYPNKGGSYEYTYGSGTIDNLSFMNNDTQSVAYLP